MSLVTRLATRATRLPGLGAGLANTLPEQSSGGRGGVKAATRNVSYVAPGQPLQTFDAPKGVYQYFASVWVMRCVRTIAQTIAGLPYRAGLDMEDPSNFVRNAPLARLLGPATPDAPGGPNPYTTSRDLWTWTIVQYIITGKWAWEIQTDGPGSKGNVAALWPLVSEFLDPIPTEGTARFFQGFVYNTPGEKIPLSTDQVFYAWRPSARDWRKPESVLDSAKEVVGVQVALDRYYANLLKHNLFSPTIVKTPPFEEPAEARAFQEQFTQEFTGFDNAGKPIFVEYESDDLSSGSGQDKGDIQVERLTQTSNEAGLLEISRQAKVDVTVALGVPESIIGNASQRTFANASEEFRNYMVITIMPLVAEIEDKVNVGLAPKVGREVGWFDLSNVDVLKPPQIIAQPSIPDLIGNNVATASQIAQILGISGVTQKGESVETAFTGEEPTSASPTKQQRALPPSETLLGVVAKTAEVRARRAARDEVRVGPHGYEHGWIKVGAAGNYDAATSTKKVANAIGVSHRKLAGHSSFASEHERLKGPASNAPDSLLHSNFTDGLLRAKDAQKKGQTAAAARHFATAVTAEAELRHRGKTPMFGNREVRSLDERQVAEFGPTGPGLSLPIGTDYDSTKAGMLAKVGEKSHRFVGRQLLACATCGKPFGDPVHIRAKRENRHQGSNGHVPLPTGHDTTQRTETEKASWLADLQAAEGPLEAALRAVFADQRKATLSRLQGKRGRQMLRTLERRQNGDQQPPDESQKPPPAVDPSAVFTSGHWADKTDAAVRPALAAVGGSAASRIRRQLGAPQIDDKGSLGTMQARLAERAKRLSAQVTETTANQISRALAEGTSQGEGVEQIASRINKIFDRADRNRARQIARTAVVGAANAAATDYAQNLPPGIVGKRRWISHHDSRVRHDHLETDGQEVPVHAPFHVGVERYPAMYPGDPTLPPSQFINCRCGQLFLPGEAQPRPGSQQVA